MSGIRLPSKTFVFGITVLAVVIIIGGLSWTLFNPNQPTVTPSPSENPQTAQNPSNSTESASSSGSSSYPANSSFPETYVLPEDVRDAAMAYINTAHHNVVQFMTNLSWTGGRIDTGDRNTETYMYYASGWTVTVQWPLVTNPVYNVSANYISEETQITWQGTYQNGNIKETSYTYNG